MTLEDVEWDAVALMARHPVRFSDPNKQLVYSVGGGGGHAGRIRLRRWAARAPLSVGRPDALEVVEVRGPFAYVPGAWTPNFADHDLFAFWDGPLLAQDELQVAEHPALGAVRQALLAQGRSTRVSDADGRPTPFTIEGVQRRCVIDVSELYGNAFARASADAVRSATRALEPPTVSRIYAMAAPVGGRGRYTTGQIDWILTAAHTAFAATVSATEGPVTLEAGSWGCGAFGGNRVLMALVQLVAASAAGVGQVRFHTLGSGDRGDLAEARQHLGRLAARLDDDPSRWVLAIHRLGLEWGVSDGN